MSTNHGGRWQFSVCPKLATEATQDCFDDRANWLTRVEYPGIPYYYLPTGGYSDVNMQWQVGDIAVLSLSSLSLSLRSLSLSSLSLSSFLLTGDCHCCFAPSPSACCAVFLLCFTAIRALCCSVLRCAPPHFPPGCQAT
jgi:hypothetical protein